MTAFIDARMSSETHDHVSSTTVITVSLHRQQQTLSSAAGDVSHAILIAVEESGRHPDHFILDDPERVEHDWVECIGVHVFCEARLSDLAVGFGVFIDICESLALCRVDVCNNPLVQDLEDFLFGQAFFRKAIIGQFDFLLAECFHRIFGGFLFQILVFFLSDKANLAGEPQDYLGGIAGEAQLSPGFNLKGSFDEPQHHDKDKEVLEHPEDALAGDPFGDATGNLLHKIYILILFDTTIRALV